MDIQSVKQRFGIIGNSPELNNALSIAIRIAPTDLSALILGESGVGKEVFSQIIHALSPRKHNPFIAVNCGAIPEGTIDSELFGHEKGAFTGAVDKRKGYFEGVDGGTIFLDEIGEMPLSTQARLLRVLETGEFIKVGSSQVQKTDVRVIAATNVNLLEAVKRHKFREDLYYRLNTVPISIPPLRDRKEDIPLLFRKFASDFAERYRTTPVTLTPEAREILVNYYWPGNIRELKNVAEQISVLSSDKQVSATELSNFLPQGGRNTQLPVLSAQFSDGSNGSPLSERDIMYRFLMDIRREVSDLRQAMLQLVQKGLVSPDMLTGMQNWEHQEYPMPASSSMQSYTPLSGNTVPPPPVVIHNATTDPRNFPPVDGFNAHEVVDESLSLMDKEKEMILKALKKHKGKRKDAALDLGISERTLYRKIREYQIAE